MEENKKTTNYIKFSALAGLMFFSPLIKYYINRDSEITEDEKIYIKWYCKVWDLNLIFLLFIVFLYLLNMKFNSEYINYIQYMFYFLIYIISSISMFFCIYQVVLRAPWEKIVQKIQHKNQIIKSFMPLLNFSLRFKQTDYSMPYRRLKESIFRWFIFIFWSLLWWNVVWIIILSIIFIRFILLLLNIDIIPLWIKKSMNSLYICNPEEIISYLSSKIIVKIKKTDYQETLQNEKLKYAQWQKIWISIIIQYLLFIWLLVYMYYLNFIDWKHQIILYIWIFIRLIRIIIFYKNKKTILKIPIISELLSIIIK